MAASLRLRPTARRDGDLDMRLCLDWKRRFLGLLLARNASPFFPDTVKHGETAG